MSRHLSLQVTGIKRGQLAICRHRQENARPRFTRDSRAATASQRRRQMSPSRSSPTKHCKHYSTSNMSANFRFPNRKGISTITHAQHAHATSITQNDVTRAYIRMPTQQTKTAVHQTRRIYSQTFSESSWMRQKSDRSTGVLPSRCWRCF